MLSEDFLSLRTNPKQSLNDLAHGLLFLDVERSVKGPLETKRQAFDAVTVDKRWSKRIESPSSSSKPDDLLSSSGVDVAIKGRELLAWLDEQPKDRREARLEHLAKRLSDWGRVGNEDGRLAALEILARRRHPAAWPILQSRLAVRPISESHLYLVAFSRLGPMADETIRSALASEIAGVFDAAMLPDSGIDESLLPQIAVEVFRTLAKTSPEQATGPICRHLARFTDFEQTALCEAIAEAVFALRERARDRRDLVAAVREKWETLVTHPAPETIDNFSGLSACVFEILARCGEDFDAELARIDAHPTMRTRILYQLAQRRLDFLSPAKRAILYEHVLRALHKKNQPRSVAAISMIVAKDLPDRFTTILRAVLCPVASDGRS